MPKKPTKRGFKVWCMCDSHNGFTCSFQVYLGATAGSVEKDLGIRATLDMTRDVFGKGFHIYCDNFFACPQLAAHLEREKTYVIGTVKKGRAGMPEFNPNQINDLEKGEDVSSIEFITIEIPAVVPPPSDVLTSTVPPPSGVPTGTVPPPSDVPTSTVPPPSDVPTGTPSGVSTGTVPPPSGVSTSTVPPPSDVPTGTVPPLSSVPPSIVSPPNVDSRYPVHCFCWKDKKPVYFINNITSPWEITTVVRKQKDGSNKAYPCPHAVDFYNKYMGGVDLADAMCRVYSCSRKSKGKWYMRLFWFLVDTCVVNAYVLECESPNRPAATNKYTKGYRTQLKFILELARQLKQQYSPHQQADSLYPGSSKERSVTVSMFLVNTPHNSNVRCALTAGGPVLGVLSVGFHCVLFHALDTTTLVCK